MPTSQLPENLKLSQAPHLQQMLAQLKVHQKVKNYLPSLSEVEYELLENDILESKRIREKLLIWQSEEGEYYLLDGHQRFEVLKKHSEKEIAWDYEVVGQLSLPQVRWHQWRLQVGRRNLTPFMLAYIRGREYIELKKAPYRPKGQPQATGNTKELLAAEFKVSPATIERDAAFYRGIERFAAYRTKKGSVKEMILRQETAFTKGELEIIAKLAEIEPQILYHFKEVGGDFRLVSTLPKAEQRDFMTSFFEKPQYHKISPKMIPETKPYIPEKSPYEYYQSVKARKSDFEQLLQKASAPSLVRRFNEWILQQRKQISNMKYHKNVLKLQTKKKELAHCLKELSEVITLTDDTLSALN